MHGKLQSFLASSRFSRGLLRLGRRLVYRDDGQVLIEFAIVVAPFLALMFAIIETALVFFAGQVLETAVQDSSRLILTGQAQKQNFDQAQFKTEVCNRIYGLFNCQSGIKVDVRKYTAFSGVNVSKPLDQNGNVDTSNFGYQPGLQGDIVVVRVVYEWPTFVRQLGLDLADLPNGKRLLMSTAAFRNEPYN